MKEYKHLSAEERDRHARQDDQALEAGGQRVDAALRRAVDWRQAETPQRFVGGLRRRHPAVGYRETCDWIPHDQLRIARFPETVTERTDQRLGRHDFRCNFTGL
ncbi:hypothetical protein [Burkholderia ubonensis]|uniref:hypothetical protein n=1 Tax=Burkholderia ubonensis TaxID=101571 RepID=UPI001E3369E4|nr:hypothetical protein [Burkholderia ubonensis]